MPNDTTPVGATARPPMRAARRQSRSTLPPLDRPARTALAFALISGLITHGYHLFNYPLYSTDEGIYAERAWAIIREGQLSPQTYYYDHAPGGWIFVAFWEFLLPRHFETFGNPINSGRVLMLLLHVVSVYLLFQIARSFSKGGLLVPTITCFFFNFSPLAIYYQRMVLLDNIMVFWFLLSLYLLLRRKSQLFAGAWSGLAFGFAVVIKENAIFFAPSIIYLLSWRARKDTNRRFAMMLWIFTASAPIITYFLLSTLKGELLPAGFDFNLARSPQGHVSLLYEMWYQVHRTQGPLLNRGSYLYTTWLPKDDKLLAAGSVAMTVCLGRGWRDRRRDPALLVAGTLSLGIAFYLVRGSVILDFYVIPLIPLYALDIGLVADLAFKRLSLPSPRVVVPAFCACVALLLLAPTGGYLIKHGIHRQLQPADAYFVPETFMQNEQVDWIRQHIPPTDRIITDDNIWVALHDVKPVYPYAQSHFNAATDPQIRERVFGGNWQNINYIALSNGMKQAMILNNGGGQESYILNALDNHSVKVWGVVHGDVSLAIYQVQP